MNRDRMPRSARLRWSTASELLRLVHAEPGIARTAACERLALSSGAAAELVERLRGARLLAEHRAGRGGRGRPTTSLGAHPRGPLTAVADLGAGGWRVLLGDLGGAVAEVAAGSYGDRYPAEFLPEVAAAVDAAARGEPGRVRAVVAAVAGAVSGTRLLQFSTRGWHEANLGVLAGGTAAVPGVPLLVGNDATLGGIAEARGGAARGAGAALHLLVAVGVGGALLVGGRPVTGARGAGGEYGHLPFGDPALACPCGARGCWDLLVDGRALARYRGDPEPADPLAYGRDVIGAVRSGTAPAGDRRAVETAARALGAGVAGLVNLHDPDAVTVAGLAPGLRAAAPEAFAAAYRAGLMAFHRADPPPVADAVHGTDGPVRGALGLGFDEITGPSALARWAALPHT
ncbi:ROK family protein [Nocardiopsis flavescens]|nr:ROK family protein [Nocardiopsis flavescens]